MGLDKYLVLLLTRLQLTVFSTSLDCLVVSRATTLVEANFYQDRLMSTASELRRATVPSNGRSLLPPLLIHSKLELLPPQPLVLTVPLPLPVPTLSTFQT